jgi:hypothetical protein
VKELVEVLVVEQASELELEKAKDSVVVLVEELDSDSEAE